MKLKTGVLLTIVSSTNASIQILYMVSPLTYTIGTGMIDVHIPGIIWQRQRLRVLPIFTLDGELHLVPLRPLLSSCTDDRGGHFHLHLAAHDNAMLTASMQVLSHVTTTANCMLCAIIWCSTTRSKIMVNASLQPLDMTTPLMNQPRKSPRCVVLTSTF